MPHYSTLIGDMVPPPPFLHRNVTLHGMFFEADLPTLQGYMDTTLNRIPGITCEILSGAVLATALFAGEVRPTNARYDNREGIAEIDCGFWALVLCGREGQAKRQFWAPLCLFVDSVFAMVIGRELYGFPKMLGSFLPVAPNASADLSIMVRTDHFLPKGERDVLEHAAPLFAIERDPSLAIPVREVDLAELQQEASGLLMTQAGVALAGTDGPSPGFPYLGMPMLFLRQLRALRRTPAAAYATVATVTMIPDHIDRVERIEDDGLRLRLFPSQSLPLDKLAGLKSGAPARLPFRVLLDFTAGEGDDI